MSSIDPEFQRERDVIARYRSALSPVDLWYRERLRARLLATPVPAPQSARRQFRGRDPLRVLTTALVAVILAIVPLALPALVPAAAGTSCSLHELPIMRTQLICYAPSDAGRAERMLAAGGFRLTPVDPRDAVKQATGLRLSSVALAFSGSGGLTQVQSADGIYYVFGALPTSAQAGSTPRPHATWVVVFEEAGGFSGTKKHPFRLARGGGIPGLSAGARRVPLQPAWSFVSNLPLSEGLLIVEGNATARVTRTIGEAVMQHSLP